MTDQTKKEHTSLDDGQRKEILKFLGTVAGRPASFRELSKELRIRRDEREAFKAVVRSLVSDGSLVKIRGGRYGIASKMNLVTGEISCHPDGFAFLTPPDGSKDIFIGPRKLAGAMHGDTVVARIEGKGGTQKGRNAGRREGSIIRVIKRAHKKIVGRFEKAGNLNVVIPANGKILERVIIPLNLSKGAAHGVMVEAEITRWPDKHFGATGRIIDILGDPEDPDVEAEVILRKYGLPSRFPDDVASDAGKVAHNISHAELKGRVDLRQRPTFTIDGETAKDFDDAVSIEKRPHGYTLFVSIADVSHYVREESAIDREAYSRGTSVYFPDRCVPMLPEALSNGICSLVPDSDRLTMTAELEIDEKGAVLKKKLYESVIRSRFRLTYTIVKKLLKDEDPELKIKYSGILPDLRLMEELALKLNRARIEAGSIDFDLPEPQIIIDMEGNIEDIVRSERNIAHRIVEEFMLSANRAVAEEFVRRGLPFVFRVHPEPAKDSIADFMEFTKTIGVNFKSSLGHMAFQGVLKDVEGKPSERLVNHVLLRSMQQAYYSEENTGHFGLAFKDYTHFTSPIRRYPDLIVHRLLRLLIGGGYTGQEVQRMEEALPRIAGHASIMERKAIDAEREVLDLKKAQFMKDKVGERFDGIISGVASFGVFVELKEYFVEGLVHTSTLADDFYMFDEKTHSLIGENSKKTFRLGDALSVSVTAVDVERRRIEFSLANGLSGKAGKARKKRFFKKQGVR